MQKTIKMMNRKIILKSTPRKENGKVAGYRIRIDGSSIYYIADLNERRAITEAWRLWLAGEVLDNMSESLKKG